MDAEWAKLFTDRIAPGLETIVGIVDDDLAALVEKVNDGVVKVGEDLFAEGLCFWRLWSGFEVVFGDLVCSAEDLAAVVS